MTPPVVALPLPQIIQTLEARGDLPPSLQQAFVALAQHVGELKVQLEAKTLAYGLNAQQWYERWQNDGEAWRDATNCTQPSVAREKITTLRERARELEKQLSIANAEIARLRGPLTIGGKNLVDEHGNDGTRKVFEALGGQYYTAPAQVAAVTLPPERLGSKCGACGWVASRLEGPLYRSGAPICPRPACGVPVIVEASNPSPAGQAATPDLWPDFEGDAAIARDLIRHLEAKHIKLETTQPSTLVVPIVAQGIGLLRDRLQEYVLEALRSPSLAAAVKLLTEGPHPIVSDSNIRSAYRPDIVAAWQACVECARQVVEARTASPRQQADR